MMHCGLGTARYSYERRLDLLAAVACEHAGHEHESFSEGLLIIVQTGSRGISSVRKLRETDTHTHVDLICADATGLIMGSSGTCRLSMKRAGLQHTTALSKFSGSKPFIPGTVGMQPRIHWIKPGN